MTCDGCIPNETGLEGAAGLKRAYTAPVLRSQRMELGVYGDYGGQNIMPYIPVDDKPIKSGYDLGQ